MLKSILSIVLAFFLGGIVHFLYSHYYLKKELKVVPIEMMSSDCEDTISYERVEKIVVKEVIKFVPKIKIIYKEKEEDNITDDLFLLALQKKEFFNAMSYYEEADEEKHATYQSALFSYFGKEQIKNSLKTIEEMQYFIEIEPESRTIVFQLAQLFEKKEQYEEALNLMVDFSYISSFNEKKSIETKIKAISINYIKKLTLSENFKDLIDFLMHRINIGIVSDFYSFELAKVYLKIKKYREAIETLEVIINNKTYKEQALEMLTYIQNKLEEQEEYPIQIPLIRSGLHFLVKVYVEDIPLVLLIDTGASTTSIDSNKINHLNVLKENVKFHTAGGDIYETIYQADTFTVESITLKKFRISGLQFSGRGQDGLLGMNFLGRFKFKIDQREAILFLGDKY